MIAAHTGSGQPMTRLMIVQEAVTVITALEQQLRGTTGPPTTTDDEGFTFSVHGQDQEQEDIEHLNACGHFSFCIFGMRCMATR